MEEGIQIPDPEQAWDYLDGFAPAIARRGELLLSRGQLEQLVCVETGRDYLAWVSDKGQNQVVLRYRPQDGWGGSCSCAQRLQCAHVYTALRGLAEFASLDDFESERPAPAPASDASLRDALKTALGRPLTREESGFLSGLERLYARCRTAQGVTQWDLRELGLDLGREQWGPLPIWPALPTTVREFWLYLVYALRAQGKAIPEFMAPVSDVAPIAARMRAWERERLVEQWKRTLRMGQHHPSALSPGAHRVELRLRLLANRAVLESRGLGHLEFKALASRAARQLDEEYCREAVAFPQPAELLWQLLRERNDFSCETEIHYIDTQGLALLGRLLRRPLLTECVVNEDGQPLRREPEPLRWRLSADPDAEDNYRLTLHRSDGTSPPPMLSVIRGPSALYVSWDAVFTGPSSWAIDLDPGKPVVIPAPALETLDGVRLLDQLGVEWPARLRERIRRETLRVSLRAKLQPLEGRSELCQICVRAKSPDGRIREQWKSGCWVPLPDQAASGAAAPQLVYYDRTALAAVPGLFTPLGKSLDVGFEDCGMRVTRKFPELFAAWLRTLPPEVEVELEGDLASLSKDSVAGNLRLEAEEKEIDWFDLQVVVNVADAELTPEEIRLLLNSKGEYVRLQGKGWRRLAFDMTAEEDEKLARLGLNPRALSAEPQRLHALQLADTAARSFLPAEQAEKIERRAGEIKARVTPPLPAGLRAELRPYQVEGFHFLAYLAANRFGGILADDMGLGKTLQTLAWLLWLRQDPAEAARPTLVVCPKSVMDNWRAEAVRFAPELRVKVWPPSELMGLPTRLAEADVHVLNYSQLRMLSQPLAAVSWLAVILDEGQYIKNPGSLTAQAARALKATHRLVLSGTPIENRLLDLWSLMSFTMPGVLGNRAGFGRLYDAKDDPLARRRLASRVRPFLLRRTKAQVASDLPDKIEEDLFCEMEGEQQTLYRAELKYARQLLLGIQTEKQLAAFQFNFLASLLRLRQVCCHPALVKTGSRAASAKMEALIELLEPLIEEGEKVLVFSQFVELLNLLQPALEEREWPLFRLTGDTENRGELVRQFQEASGAAVFLISLKAGGFGLNLTAASYVVLFDPWWNPAVENQAIDRTHRIGQERKVIAYRLLIKGTVEEKIRTLQRQKSALAQDVLGEEKFAQSLTLDDLRFLLEDV